MSDKNSQKQNQDSAKLLLKGITKYDLAKSVLHPLMTISVIGFGLLVLNFFILNPINVDRSEIDSREHVTPDFLKRNK